MMTLFSRDTEFEMAMRVLTYLRSIATDETGRDLLLGASIHLCKSWRDHQDASSVWGGKQ